MPRALIFDVDGTLADTEEVHRQAFNMAFLRHGLEWDWSRECYAGLLRVTGGKERIRRFISGLSVPPAERARLEQIVALVHGTKTRVFAELIEMGEAALRPGIARLIAEARAAGVRIAIASTTTPANVSALVTTALGRDAMSWFRAVATGDVVAKKKPAPDIYLLALAMLGLASSDCVAFEDSELGVRAAKAAGLLTIATPTLWTCEQDLGAADLMLPSLGDPEQPLDPASSSRIGGAPYLGLAQLASLRAAAALAAAQD